APPFPESTSIDSPEGVTNRTALPPSTSTTYMSSVFRVCATAIVAHSERSIESKTVFCMTLPFKGFSTVAALRGAPLQQAFPNDCARLRLPLPHGRYLDRQRSGTNFPINNDGSRPSLAAGGVRAVPWSSE